MSDARGSALDAVVAHVRDRIWRECDASAIVATGDDAARVVAALARSFIDDVGVAVRPTDVDDVVRGVVAATLGLGPLQSLMADSSISEIMVNGPSDVFVERRGVVERVPTEFEDAAHVLRVIDRIVAPVGRRVDAFRPMVDARLPDGSRVHAIVPPLAVDGPVLTIRRFVPVASSLVDLVDLGSLTSRDAERIEELVTRRANVIVSGGTSTGKTTLLAAALTAAAHDDRIVVIEESTELPLDHPHRVRLESRPPNPDGTGAVDVRELVRNALRMRPDRIVVGEVRGAESFDLLQALNTGHRGSWSTVHANGPADALVRLESMALCAGSGVPQQVMRAQVARAVDAVVHLTRDDSGGRALDAIGVVTDRNGTWELDV